MKIPLISSCYEIVDVWISGLIELWKTVLIEMYLLSGQIVDDFFAVLLYFFFDVKKFLAVGMKKVSVFSSKERIFDSFNSLFSPRKMSLKRKKKLREKGKKGKKERSPRNQRGKKERSPTTPRKQVLFKKMNIDSKQVLFEKKDEKHVDEVISMDATSEFVERDDYLGSGIGIEDEDNFSEGDLDSIPDAMSVISIYDLVEQERKRRKLWAVVKKMAKNVLKLISLFVIPWVLLIFPNSRKTKVPNVENSNIFSNAKKCTGLIELIHLKNLEFCDLIGEVWKKLIRFQLFSVFGLLKKTFSLYRLKNFVSGGALVDERSVADHVKDDGFPVEQMKVETKDGYILQMDRIVNRKSKKVLFLQHGILDSSFCWISNKNKSIAYRSFNRGYDIFMGNFRGHSSSRHKDKNFGSKFWDFSINELGLYDIRAFIEAIMKTKQKELNEKPENIEITVCSHSMGGGSTLAYLSYSKIKKFNHHVKKAILLAPAGIHESIPIFWRAFSKLHPILYVLRVRYLGINSRILKILFTGIALSFITKSGTRSFLSSLSSKSLLGGSKENSPLNYFSNLFFHIFYGTSRRLLLHFVQLLKKKEFYAFDYGSKKKNMEEYNQPTPVRFSDYYGDIDVPIVFCSGDKDQVIPPFDVRRHYIKMIKQRKENIQVQHKYKVFKDTGHIDLTYSITESMILYIEQQLKETETDNKKK